MTPALATALAYAGLASLATVYAVLLAMRLRRLGRRVAELERRGRPE